MRISNFKLEEVPLRFILMGLHIILLQTLYSIAYILLFKEERALTVFKEGRAFLDYISLSLTTLIIGSLTYDLIIKKSKNQ